MKKILLAAFTWGLALAGGSVYGQQTICGNETLQETINNDAYLKAKHDAYFQNYAEENRQLSQDHALAQSKGTAEYDKILIPVVFHIVLNPTQIASLGGDAGIIARINSQLETINEDFGGTNSGLTTLPAAFQPIVGKANISFALAKRDVNGKAKLGIVYVTKPASFTGYTGQDLSVKRTVQGGSSPWDHTKYLNIWITNITGAQGNGQVLGYGYNADYAQTVIGDPATAGIVLHYLTLGRRTDIGQNFYSPVTEKGRTLTHELGHYFNIWHIWGQSAASNSTSCADDDGIDDTPLQAGANTSCPFPFNIKKDNCVNKPHAGGEMYMNFMDYSTDMCTEAFTKGQVDRMRAETNPGGKVHSVTINPHLAFWPADVPPVEYNNKVDVGPNPNNGLFNIRLFEKYDELKSITIVNAMGQLVKEIAITDQQAINYSVDLSGMPKGIYIAQLHFDLGTITRKVAVQ